MLGLDENLRYAGIGSRRIDEEGRRKALLVAKRMRELGWTCLSGHAPGADQTFEVGAGSQAEIYKPWASFERHVPVMADVVYNEPTPLAYEIAETFHPAWYAVRRGARPLMARNSHQVLGRDCQTPVRAVVCWTPNGEEVGGTAQAMRIAHHWNITIYNLARERDVRWLGTMLDIDLRNSAQLF